MNECGFKEDFSLLVCWFCQKIKKGFCSTVWKFRNFSAIQILRENGIDVILRQFHQKCFQVENFANFHTVYTPYTPNCNSPQIGLPTLFCIDSFHFAILPAENQIKSCFLSCWQKDNKKHNNQFWCGIDCFHKVVATIALLAGNCNSCMPQRRFEYVSRIFEKYIKYIDCLRHCCC